VEEPSLARNPISLAGAALTTISALAFVIYYISHALGWWTSPYAGLIGFIAIPAFFLLGLLPIPFGMWREGRRRRRGKPAWRWPAIDLSSSRTRQVLFVVLVLTLVNVGIVTLAALGAAHYMETTSFCGQTCHVPMRPEFTAHQEGAHARVTCVACHISPGAAGTIRAKRNGTRQLYLVLRGTFARPIPTPARGLPVAADTCAHCHQPGFPMADITRVTREYDDDEANTETVGTLVVAPNHVHWHARGDVRVEYVATDEKRETIPYMRVTGPDGRATEYFASGITARPAGELRQMDCLDCHSRPAHTMSASAGQSVDRAIASEAVSRTLPFVRRELVAALSAPYPDEDAALAGIASRLTTFYQGRPKANPALVTAAIGAGQRLFRTNVFPEMKVTWGTYRNQLGHSDDVPGCFRCHDDEHKASDGRLVRQDCELCHKEQ
jgi:NapC/NirT cytochrome c family, N-terminal region